MSILFATHGAHAADRPQVLLAFGDSLTAGYGLGPGKGYPEVLEGLLRKAGREVRVVNAGVSGDTSGDGLARLDWTLAERPDAAIVCLGANDALRGLPVARMERNLDAILARFEQEKIPVLLAGMKAPMNLGAAYTTSFAAVFPRLAEKHHDLLYPFLLEGVAANPALNQGDGIHPNARGATEIARRILPYAEKLLDRAAAKAP
ncbi:lipolytic protein [Desulfovibrio sp. X2]|uniref:arylesterase n=1 Tax=Desulfovibrio sp. X2 TaxID=941449 RepID=UPI000358F3B8|nr:arylesterase [Desulfovibrio sp. X2]EPR37055.1 lipolytic protein [Desulfovibrio sp. X2]